MRPAHGPKFAQNGPNRACLRSLRCDRNPHGYCANDLAYTASVPICRQEVGGSIPASST